MITALTIYPPNETSRERKESCLHKIGKQVCGLAARVIENQFGEALGTVCSLRHVVSKMKRQKKCKGCRSRIKFRHVPGCRVGSELIEMAIQLATDWQEDASCEEDWSSIQEEIEEVFQFADWRLGGPL